MSAAASNDTHFTASGSSPGARRVVLTTIINITRRKDRVPARVVFITGDAYTFRDALAENAQRLVGKLVRLDIAGRHLVGVEEVPAPSPTPPASASAIAARLQRIAVALPRLAAAQVA